MSSPSHETIDMNTGLLSYYQPILRKQKKVSLRLKHFEERQIPKQIHNTLTYLKKNISIRKMHWLAQDLRKVKFRWNQVSSWQHGILREKNLTLVACFLLPLKRVSKKSVTLAAYFLRLETPGFPACYPLIPPFSFRRIMFIP